MSSITFLAPHGADWNGTKRIEQPPAAQPHILKNILGDLFVLFYIKAVRRLQY